MASPLRYDVAPRHEESRDTERTPSCIILYILIPYTRCSQHNLPVIDLRLVCCDPADYANAIEPSSFGGEKITDNIVKIVADHDFSKPASIYTVGHKSAAALAKAATK